MSTSSQGSPATLIDSLRLTLASVERTEPTPAALHAGLLAAATELGVDESRTLEILRAVYRDAFKRMALESAHDLDADTLVFAPLPRLPVPNHRREHWVRRWVAAMARPLLRPFGGPRG